MPENRTDVDIFGAKLTRRQWLKAGGALVVGFALVGEEIALGRAAPAVLGNMLDPSLLSSWIEIRSDNTVLIRTGKTDFGQGTVYTAYRQIVAEELCTSFESITTVVQGDTDRTPDGSGAFDFLARGTPNLRKAAAYAYQALLDLASQRLGVPKESLTVEGGVVTGAAKSMSYGELVKGHQLKLTIPVSGSLTSKLGLYVTGAPPMKPVSRYTIIGKSYANSMVASKVTAKEQWATDVRLPGMLHARVAHPKTLGSQLIVAGTLDKTRFPNSQVVVKGNLVGIVAPTEWEAIQASRQIAATTKWTEWKGLPGSANLHAHLRNADWKASPVSQRGKSGADVKSTLDRAAKKLTATYEMPYHKHAPMGTSVAVADVRADGSVTVYTHSQNPQALRGQLALMLGAEIGAIVVRSLAGPGQFGRSNGGNAGAEDEAVLLSKAVGKPVRLQWMRAEDFQWSTQSPAAVSDIEIALDAGGRITGYQVDHYMPGLRDDRPIGALLAGLPTMSAPDVRPPTDFSPSTQNLLNDQWVYDGVPALIERGHGTFQIGQKASPIAVGLRDHSMRTPGQFQQNFPRELAMSEAAALAGADAIQFRIDHTSQERLIGVLKAVRDASGWKTRPAPLAKSVAANSTRALRGRGVSVIARAGAYWACVCEIAVTPATGEIKVEKYTVAVDPGIVVNPLQLKRQVEGGAVMGLSQALLEESKFDESGVTVKDWRSYPILTMADLPEINVVLLNRPEVGAYGGGSEAANALAAPAIAAALFDATGKIAHRLPLRPEYVKSLFRS
jgi:CO/xanthine dehydrogenase Mo-binding subunit